MRASDDFDVFEGSRDVTKPIEESFKLQKMPNFDTDEDYYHLVSILNEKQQKYLLEILHRETLRFGDSLNCEANYVFLAGCAGTGKSLLIR